MQIQGRPRSKCWIGGALIGGPGISPEIFFGLQPPQNTENAAKIGLNTCLIDICTQLSNTVVGTDALVTAMIAYITLDSPWLH